MSTLRLARERRYHTRQHRETQIDLSRLVQRLSFGSCVFHTLRACEIHQRQLAYEDAARLRRGVGEIGSQATLADDLENRV